MFLFSQIVEIIYFTRPNSQQTSGSSSYIFCLSNHFNFFFYAKNHLLVTVAMLSLCQSSVNCRSRNVEYNFTYKKVWPLLLSSFSPVIYVSTWKSRILLYSKIIKGWILKLAHFLENYFGLDDGQCGHIQYRPSYVCRSK